MNPELSEEQVGRVMKRMQKKKETVDRLGKRYNVVEAWRNATSFTNVLKLAYTIFGKAVMGLFLQAYTISTGAASNLLMLLTMPVVLLKAAYDDFRNITYAELVVVAASRESAQKSQIGKLSPSLLARVRKRFVAFLSLFGGLSKGLFKTVLNFMLRAVVLPTQALVQLLSYVGFTVVNLLYYVAKGKFPRIKRPLKQEVLLSDTVQLGIQNMATQIIKRYGFAPVPDPSRIERARELMESGFGNSDGEFDLLAGADY